MHRQVLFLAASVQVGICGSVSHVLAQAELDQSWVVTLNGEFAQVRSDGSFDIYNIPIFVNPWTFESIVAHRLTGLGGQDEALYVFTPEQFLLQHDGVVDVMSSALLVTPVPPPLIDVLEASVFPNTIEAGSTANMLVVAHVANGDEMDVTMQQNWTTYVTTNPSIAAVDANGSVTGIGAGTAFITASNEGASAAVRIDVVFAEPTDIEGFVFLEDGAPAVGAAVDLPGLAEPVVLTDAAGFFQYAGVEVGVLSTVVAEASLTIGGDQYSGSSASHPVVFGGITDLGVIVLEPPDPGPLFNRPEWLIRSHESGEYRDVIVADLDSDNDQDVVAVLDGKYVIFRNRGAGTLDIEGPTAIPGILVWQVDVADFDGDQRLDLLFNGSEFGGDDVALILYNLGNGSFSHDFTYAPNLADVGSARAADLDNDGDMDVAISLVLSPLVNCGAECNRIAVLWNSDGLGSFVEAQIETGLSGSSQVGDIVPVDLNSDGHVDLVQVTESTVTAHINDQMGNFSQDPSPATGCVGHRIRVGDVLGDDGVAEILGSCIGNPTRHLHLYAFDPATGSMALESVLLATGGRSYDSVEVIEESATPLIAVGDGLGDRIEMVTVASGELTPTGGFIDIDDHSPELIRLSDIDNDGDRDVLVLTEFPTKLKVVLDDGGQWATDLHSTELADARLLMHDSDGDGRLDGLPDLDGDGFIDLLTTGTLSNEEIQASLHPGNGDGTFGSPVSMTVLAPGWLAGVPRAALGDIDDDQDVDVMFTLLSTEEINGEIIPTTETFAMINKGSTIVQGDSFVFNMFNGYPGPLLVDLDGDGWRDLVGEGHYVVNPGLSGDWSAAAMIEVGCEEGGQRAVADLDADSQLDWIQVDTICLNDGGTFVPWTTIPNFSPNDHLLVAHHSGEARHVVSPHSGLNRVEVVRDVHLGTPATDVYLTVVQSQTSGEETQSYVADLNGDVRDDVVLLAQSRAVIVLLSRPDGTLNDPLYFATRDYPTGLSLGLVDGDNRPDLIVTTQVGLTVLINRLP